MNLAFKNTGIRSAGERKLMLKVWSPLLIVIATASLAAAQSPVIQSISKITTQQFQTIAITGSGFGTQKAYTGNSDYISLLDSTAGWQGGYEGCLLGFCTTDTVTIIVQSWTDSKIVLGGFSGAWGTDGYTLSVGDSVQVSVFNAQTSAGPAQVTVTIAGETTTTTLTSSPNPSNEGETVTFTATVASASGPPPDGEIVTFAAGKKSVTAKLSGGTATVKTSTLGKGTYSVTATYGGDTDFGDSKSKPVSQVVQ